MIDDARSERKSFNDLFVVRTESVLRLHGQKQIQFNKRTQKELVVTITQSTAKQSEKNTILVLFPHTRLVVELPTKRKRTTRRSQNRIKRVYATRRLGVEAIELRHTVGRTINTMRVMTKSIVRTHTISSIVRLPNVTHLQTLTHSLIHTLYAYLAYACRWTKEQQKKKWKRKTYTFMGYIVIVKLHIYFYSLRAATKRTREPTNAVSST